MARESKPHSGLPLDAAAGFDSLVEMRNILERRSRLGITKSAWGAACCLGLALGTHAAVDTSYLRDHAATRGFMLGRPVGAKPVPDGSSVVFLQSEARSPQMKLFEFDVASAKAIELLSPSQLLQGREESLSAEEKARRERMRVSAAGFTEFQISPDGRQLLVSLSGRLYMVGRTDGRIQELKTGAGVLVDPKFSPDGKWVSYVLGNDVHGYELAKSRERRVTEGGTELVQNGVAEFVAQEEMGRFSGYWWAPESDAIAFAEVDLRPVEIWHLADPSNPEGAPLTWRYPRPGKNNVSVRLGVKRLAGSGVKWIQWDSTRYPYLARVDWDRRGGLTLLVQTRDQREVLLLRADARTGATTLLLRQQDTAWVNLEQAFPLWLENGDGFLWATEAEAGTQLEWRGNDGALRRVVAPPQAGFLRVADVNMSERTLIVEASPDPGQSHLFKAHLEGGTAIALTEGRGRHRADYSKNHELVVHTRTEPGKMPETVVRHADGRHVGVLPSVAEQPPITPRIEWMRAGKSNQFHAMLLRPKDFSAGNTYPVLLSVYGGPGANVVQSDMAPHLLKQWMADQGFVVVSIDGRGTPGRGRSWERAVEGKFGSVPLDDQVEGLETLLARYPELDRSRVGIYGWSFGGYLSALAALKRPDVFRAAVAGAPVCEWTDYDTHYTERYLGMPNEQPAAYQEGSLLTHIGAHSSPILIIHGTADDNVFFRHSLRLADGLFRAGRPFEMVTLAGATHGVRDTVLNERMYARMVDFFFARLGGQ